MRLLLCIACSFLSGAIQAETVIIEPSQDNTLYESTQSNLSNGAGNFLFTGETASNGSRRALVAFKDLSAIPAGATIESVMLHVYVSKETSPQTTVRLLRLVSDWGEGASLAPGSEGGGGAAMPGDATWNHRFFDTTMWASPGGDFAATESAQLPIDSVGAYTFGSTDAMVADVQDWLDNPGSNFGWILIAGEGSQSSKRLNSREGSNTERRPRLEIVYSTTQSGPPSDWSGAWFDPTLDGEGYLVFNTPVGWLIYFFGYSADNDRLWLISNIIDIENLVFGQEYQFPMLVGAPGSFGAPTPSTELISWGTLSILLNNCLTGVFVLDGADGMKTSNVQKLVGVEGTTCTTD